MIFKLISNIFIENQVLMMQQVHNYLIFQLVQINNFIEEVLQQLQQMLILKFLIKKYQNFQ